MTALRNTWLAAMFIATVSAQTPKTLLGTVTEFKARSLEMGLKPDDGGGALFVKFGPETQVIQIPAGEHNFAKSKPVKITDIALGDRVMVSFVDGMTDARRIVLISSTDILKRNEAERLDWQKRGVSGVVSSKADNEIAVESRSANGVEVTTVEISSKTTVKRYAPDSVKFSDAEPSTIAEIAIGDQVRTRGGKSEDGKRLQAQDVVFGTFLTRLGSITAIDREAREFTINDLTTKRPVTIRLSADSRVKKMPDMNGGPPRSSQQHGPPAGAATMAQILESLPAGNLDDLKVGGAVVATSTRGATPDKVTAIMVVANVDALIKFAILQAGGGADPMEALGKMHGGMMGGPGGFNLPAMMP